MIVCVCVGRSRNTSATGAHLLGASDSLVISHVAYSHHSSTYTHTEPTQIEVACCCDRLKAREKCSHHRRIWLLTVPPRYNIRFTLPRARRLPTLFQPFLHAAGFGEQNHDHISHLMTNTTTMLSIQQHCRLSRNPRRKRNPLEKGARFNPVGLFVIQFRTTN